MAAELTDVDARLDELVAIAAPYWAGEAEVVRTYFGRPRSKQDDIRWLRAQAWKEFFGQLEGDPNGLVWGPINELRDSYPPIGRDARHRFLHVAEELYEEFHHYAMLADILDELEGRPVSPEELRPCAEDARLTELRKQNAVREGDLGVLANKFTEGGGSGMYIAGSQITGGELEQRIAAAFRTIVGDEIGHMQSGARGLSRLIKTDRDWENVKRMVADVSRQRVRMRNDMFGNPLSEDRLREIDEGKIEPLNRDILSQ